MRFAKVVFTIAGIWGIFVLTPLYFGFDAMGRLVPPAINHPQYYYGFSTVALVWQFVFLLIAWDPSRFRPLILAAIAEKAVYVLSLIILHWQQRITPAEALPAIPDGILAIWFVAAYFKTRGAPSLTGTAALARNRSLSRGAPESRRPIPSSLPDRSMQSQS